MIFRLPLKIDGRVKSFSLTLSFGAALFLHTPAFSQAPGETSAGFTNPCQKSSAHVEMSASALKLLPEIHDATGIIEVREKGHTPRRLAWNFDGFQHTASIACYRDRLIAVQVMPTASSCLMSIRKNTQQGAGLPAQAIDKMLCY